MNTLFDSFHDELEKISSFSFDGSREAREAREAQRKAEFRKKLKEHGNKTRKIKFRSPAQQARLSQPKQSALKGLLSKLLRR